MDLRIRASRVSSGALSIMLVAAMISSAYPLRNRAKIRALINDLGDSLSLRPDWLDADEEPQEDS